MINKIFYGIVGIIIYNMVMDLMNRFSDSVDDSGSIIKSIVTGTNQYLQNYWVTRLSKQPFHYLFCHIQIMEILEFYTYGLYWLAHKIVVVSIMYTGGWVHLTKVQTGVILCIVTYFVLCFHFDVQFDITYIDINLESMGFLASEFFFSFMLIAVTQFLTEYSYDDHFSIYIYNCVFFSNQSYSMFLLFLHCIGIIAFDLYVNDYSIEIQNMTEKKNLILELERNITVMNNSLPGLLDHMKEEHIQHIRFKQNSVKQVQNSLNDTVLHIRFILVMIHLATMFFLLSTYFTGPANYVATQYDGETPKPDYQETFMSDAEIQDYEARREQAIADAAAQANAGPPVVGNDGADPVQPDPIVIPPQKTYLWKLEPHHFLTCIKVTVFSTLAHMVLFVVTILLSPYAWRFYLVYASVFTLTLKIIIHNTAIPVSKQNVCYMNPYRFKMLHTPQGLKSLGFLCFSQIIMAVYFNYYYK